MEKNRLTKLKEWKLLLPKLGILVKLPATNLETKVIMQRHVPRKRQKRTGSYSNGWNQNQREQC